MTRPRPTPIEPQWLTVAEAAAYCSSRRETVYQMIWAGCFPEGAVARWGPGGTGIRIRRSALEAFMAGGGVQPRSK